jgi:hypothetical protein
MLQKFGKSSKLGGGRVKGATTFSLTTFSIKSLFATLSIIDIQNFSMKVLIAVMHYAECHDYLNVMLSAVMLNVDMLSVVMLNVVVLSVMAPSEDLPDIGP